MKRQTLWARLCLIFIPCTMGLSFVDVGNANPADRYADAYKQYLDAGCPLAEDDIKHFVYFARDREEIHGHPFLEIGRFEGAQIMYSWAMLEPTRDQYDFSLIWQDYNYLRSRGKKLFIQLQDKTFNPNYRGVPEYLNSFEFDGGSSLKRNEKGEPEGWVAKRWNKHVQQRFALLLLALGREFDAKIEGINLQESALGEISADEPGFCPARYAEALRENMTSLKQAFPDSTTMQYANFMPGEWLPWEDHGFLKSIYVHGEAIGVGLGGPDLMVRRKGQLNHTIAMMHEGEFTAPLGIAIQDGNYIGQTGDSVLKKDRDNIVPLLHAFAKDFLKVDYMFWVNEEPYFEEDVLPCFIPANN